MKLFGREVKISYDGLLKYSFRIERADFSVYQNIVDYDGNWLTINPNLPLEDQIPQSWKDEISVFIKRQIRYCASGKQAFVGGKYIIATAAIQEEAKWIVDTFMKDE